jgi:enamine deaminase RidA (YjgF/YER057c/UK114 family)
MRSRKTPHQIVDIEPAVTSVTAGFFTYLPFHPPFLLTPHFSDMSQLHRIGVASRYSEAAIFNGVVYLAGQVPETTLDDDIAAQTQEVLALIETLLEQAGSDKSRILSCQIFIADLADFDGMNRIWDNWVAAGHAPPRATVEAKLANPKFRLEIVVTAAQHIAASAG